MNVPALDAVSSRLCSQCQGWLCAPDDAFCGSCGLPCANLELQASATVFTLGQIAPKIFLSLTNHACVPLRILRRAASSWLELPPLEDVEIPAGASHQFTAKAATLNLAEPQSTELRIQTSIGESVLQMMVIPEWPIFTAVPPQLEYWEDKAVLPSYHLECYPAAGIVRVLGIGRPSAAWIKVLEAIEQPVLVSRESPLSLRLQFDPAYLPGGAAANLGKKLKVSVELLCDGPHGSIPGSLPVNVDFRRPPELAWREEHSPPRILPQTSGQIVQFTLDNSNDLDQQGGRQNGRLEIREAVLRPPSPIGVETVQLRTPLPLRVAGGESAALEFQVNLESFPDAISSFELSLWTNRPALDRTYKAPVQVRPMDVFEGIVAIDFGTSNTCCALLPDGGDFESVPLDETQTIAPTIVRYLDLSGPEPLTETGARIKHLAAVDEKVASSTASRLKQQLGESTYPLTIRPLSSSEWLTREAREAAADYLRHLRAIAEKRRGVLFNEFILTHPAVCSLRQYRNLRLALEDAFGKNAKIHFLQEPLASLIPFFSQISRNGAPPAYTVAAFDLGGGTTDITVVQVRHAMGARGVKEIRPEVIASWGERFGGEDLTDFLVEEIKVRSRKLLQSTSPGYQIADRQVRGASTASIRRNESVLREWAESFKASLSEEKGTTPTGSILLSVVPEDLDLSTEERQFSMDDVRHRGEDLERVFLGFLGWRINKLADRLQESIKNVPELNYVHLSGKTAFLGEVARVLQSRFQGVIIERAHDPKECVVHGACMWRSLIRGRNRRLVLPGVRRTTSQIGMLDEEGVFEAVIDVDQPIPDSGLIAEAKFAWNGQDPVLLWENLGVEKSRLRPDGSPNPLITKLGTWQPAETIVADDWLPLRLHLLADFTLQVTAETAEKTIVFRPPERTGRSS